MDVSIGEVQQLLTAFSLLTLALLLLLSAGDKRQADANPGGCVL